MHQVEASTGATPATGRHGILRRLGIYLLMIAWSVGGLAYTEVNSTHVVTFWLITTVLFAIIAIAHVYRSGAANRTSLALKQLVHWGAFFAAMVLLHSHLVVDLVAGDPSLIVVLILLLASMVAFVVSRSTAANVLPASAAGGVEDGAANARSAAVSRSSVSSERHSSQLAR